LEEIRKSKFPGKPSRLNAVFLLETFEEALWYKENLANTNLVYEVDAETEGVVIHRGDYTKVGPVNQPMLDAVPRYAEEYWSHVPTERIEVVYRSRFLGHGCCCIGPDRQGALVGNRPSYAKCVRRVFVTTS
jgi:hypothetical protein